MFLYPDQGVLLGESESKISIGGVRIKGSYFGIPNLGIRIEHSEWGVRLGDSNWDITYDIEI